MDKPLTIFDVAGRAMSAQLVRMNTTASNLANAGGVAGTQADAYRSMKPVFKTSYDKATGLATVDVKQVVTAGPMPTKRHDPNHPMADKDGNVWDAGVDSAAELVEMLETARQYQNIAQVLQTAKTLTLDTIRMGK